MFYLTLWKRAVIVDDGGRAVHGRFVYGTINRRYVYLGEVVSRRHSVSEEVDAFYSLFLD